jgi:hypothetical protein
MSSEANPPCIYCRFPTHGETDSLPVNHGAHRAHAVCTMAKTLEFMLAGKRKVSMLVQRRIVTKESRQ